MPQRIYRVVAYGKQLPGASGSQRLTVSAVAKGNSADAPYCVANELICSEIGRVLRLPLPPAGLTYGPTATDVWFGSLDFNLTPDALPPVDPADCCQQLPHLATGVLLFDVLVANSDRHTGNLSLDATAQPARMMVFDHSHALFGSKAGDGTARLAFVHDRLAISGGSTTGGNRHCLLDALNTAAHLAEWEERIGKIPDYFIADVCEESVDLGITRQEADKARDFLKHRRDNMRVLIDNHRAEFRGITQWRLI